MVQADPARLDLSLRKKNLGLNEITIQSLDNQPFSIKSFASTNCNCITAEIDPNTRYCQMLWMRFLPAQ